MRRSAARPRTSHSIGSTGKRQSIPHHPVRLSSHPPQLVDVLMARQIRHPQPPHRPALPAIAPALARALGRVFRARVRSRGNVLLRPANASRHLQQEEAAKARRQQGGARPEVGGGRKACQRGPRRQRRRWRRGTWLFRFRQYLRWIGGIVCFATLASLCLLYPSALARSGL